MRKQAQFMGNRGMNQDMSISKYSPEFTFMNYNIRINSDNESTLLSLNNTRGNKKIMLYDEDGYETVIHGTVINYTVVNKYIVLFTTTRETSEVLYNNASPKDISNDRIYRLEEYADGFRVKLIHTGILNFAKDALIESIGIYESDSLIKVYWADKYNQPRAINIVSDNTSDSNMFNFCPYLDLKETHTLTKNPTGGKFHSGVIQYAFTYWNLNGAESNIFLSTELQSISDTDKGGSPEDIHTCSFTVEVDNIESGFDYIRMYSIQRTTIDATPIVRKVRDIKLKDRSASKVTFHDDGSIGELFPSESLLFVGGEELVVGTIASKDNALFAGDLLYKRPSLESINITNTNIEWEYATEYIDNYRPDNNQGNSGLYPYKPYTLTSTGIRHWKKGETYRFGLRAQYITGLWSEVIYINDVKVTKSYKTSVTDSSNNWTDGLKVDYIKGKYTLETTVVNELLDLGYRKVQLVYVPLEGKDRDVLGQGFITSTIANIGNRNSNSPFAYPDFLARGNQEFTPIETPIIKNRTTLGRRPKWINTEIISGDSYVGAYLRPGEISGASELPNNTIEYLHLMDTDKHTDHWHIDTNLVNFWSPEVEYGNIQHNLSEDIRLELRGIANMSAVSMSTKILFEDSSEISKGDSSVNYTTRSDHMIIGYDEYPVKGGTYDSGNDRITGTIWDGDMLRKVSSKTGKRGDVHKHSIVHKAVSRFVYCGFNDMIVPNNVPEYSIYKPKYIDKSDPIASYNSNPLDGSGGNLMYNNHVEEVGALNKDVGATHINYKANSHLLFSFRNNKTIPKWISTNRIGVPNTFNNLYYRDSSTGHTTDILNNSTLLGMNAQQILNRKSADSKNDSGFTYLWIGDLVRKIDPTVKYGGNTKEAIEANIWIPASDAVDIRESNTLIADRGDTYIQRYDVLRISNNNSDIQKTSEVVSVLLESFINLDGRYDTKRGGAGIENYTTDNYTHVNQVYSQKDNFFAGVSMDYDKFKNDHLISSYLVTQPKKHNEFIDKWTNLWLNNATEVNGGLGKLNKLINFNNEIFGFQDKGIFQALYNSRVQIPTSDGVPIEITQSMKSDGVRYMSTSLGATNKWGIKTTNKGLYFIDSINKDLYMMGEQPMNVSEEVGFKTWFNNNLKNLNVYDLQSNQDAFILNTDYSNDDLFINTKYHSLNFSERLGGFESFHSHENIPWMFNHRNRFISISINEDTSTLWENNINDIYNRFYGHKRPSLIEFHLNPEPHLDKVFDNFEYRADVVDQNGVYLAGSTFTDVTVKNEYQYGTAILNTPMSAFRNKKFRTWSFPFPRQKRSLDRIRNPWVKMTLKFDNPSNHKLYFHDMIITYNI